MPLPPASRREFLAAAAAVGVAATAPSSASAARDKSDLRIAVIGARGRGKSHIDGFRDQLVAVCDVDQDVLDGTVARFKEKRGRTLDKHVDYRELLDRDDIDAVSIATPNHTHSLIGIAAVQAGKDVYVEKPVSNNVWEGRQLVAAARKNRRIVQAGTQSRSSKCLQEAVAFVQGGGLGKIQYALGTCYKPRPAIGKLDAPLSIPSTIDYDLWCGPADKVDLYRPKLHYDWHWDYNTGAGDMGNQGIHQMDIARWFLGENGMAPRTFSVGARLGYEDGGDTANTQMVVHEYESAPLIFETRGLPRSKEGQKQWGRSMDEFRGSRIGVIVQCEGGHVVAPASYRDVYAYDRSGKLVKHFKGSGDHFGNFLSAVSAGDASRLNADIAEGHVSSALCHAGNVSHRIGERASAGEIASSLAHNELLSYSFDRMATHLRANDVDIDRDALVLGEWIEVDPASETLVNSEAGQQYWKREGRDGFKVPSVEAV
ncbi:4-carboxy-2-hydroxymuconate-6-semialdehyde dehydrogenase [Posidoniimonas corsicana]|uniref:4-carboxy-2-hydroxymuconate-6-semialdehyde dehydrogenase n=1 Tax=Posidoniimonas corsicana TaxID=1938618 RepID=A0A5C5V4T6_9BACT|nr:Gfo/Idh/MocA family oxidoreductase [Posidoniimonas corsicana]TWT33548.1 4-carboxy-2-hydroxymuconate-6-semialdehyde dehydrogenase [Posidoniimonas corsicana]